MARLVGDILLLVFSELHNDPSSLHSCILVNTTWCHIAIPLLWNYISDSYENPYNYKRESREKFYNVIAHFLPNDPEDPLPQNDIVLPLNKFSRRPMFNYMNFFTRLTTIWIKDMAQLSVIEGSEYKRKILELEIYKLVFNKCNNVKYFYWNTKKKLYQYPNIKTFFSNLHSFDFNFKVMTSKILSKLSKICQNLKNLEINECNKDSQGLVSFIEAQKNLRSLCLNFDFDTTEENFTLLSNAIIKKAATLKKVAIQPITTLISPTFIPSLKNLQYLTLNNEFGDNVKLSEWEYYLSMASFPYLQYLEVSYLPSSIACLIIEKSGENILEIKIHNPIESLVENKKLIKTISNNCSKLIRLTMNIDCKNLSEISMIFSNCKQLEKVYFTTNVSTLPNGDELLRVMSNVSPTTLQEFSFGDNLNFSLRGLESFFENWKSKNNSPIKFIHYYDELFNTWTKNHDKVVEKYKSEKVIR